MQKNSGYIISLVAGCIAGAWNQFSVIGVLSGILFAMSAGLIIAGVISIFYKSNFEKIFTAVCVFVSLLSTGFLGLLGAPPL